MIAAGIGVVVAGGLGWWLRQRRYLSEAPCPVSVWLTLVWTTTLVGVLALVAWRVPARVLEPVCVFVVAGWAAGWIDLDCHRLPDWVTWPLVAVLGVFAAAMPGTFWRAVLCAVLLGAGAFVWALFTGMGLGDVKLLLSMGLLLGHAGGWSLLAAGLVWMLLVGAAWAVVLLAAGASRSSAMPFGPAIVAGVVGCVCITPGLT